MLFVTENWTVLFHAFAKKIFVNQLAEATEFCQKLVVFRTQKNDNF